MPTVTMLYAALIALVFVALSARVILYRRGHRLGLGDHGDKRLLKLMRAQANCAEYAPIGLLLMLLVELAGAPHWSVHALGLLLLAGRVAHGAGFSASPQIMGLRVLGMALTLTQIVLAAILCLWMALV